MSVNIFFICLPDFSILVQFLTIFNNFHLKLIKCWNIENVYKYVLLNKAYMKLNFQLD